MRLVPALVCMVCLMYCLFGFRGGIRADASVPEGEKTCGLVRGEGLGLRSHGQRHQLPKVSNPTVYGVIGVPFLALFSLTGLAFSSSSDFHRIRRMIFL